MHAITSSFRFCLFRLIALFVVAGIVSRLNGQVADDPVTVPVQFQGLYNADATGDVNNPASISISPDGTNFAVGTSAGGSNQLTSNGVARLRPGRTYLFTANTYYLTRLRVKVTAPAGYRIFINTVEHEMFDWQMGNPTQHLDAVGHFSVRLDDGAGAAVGEAASLRPGRVLWSVGLGNLRNGKPAGSIVMAENGLTATTYQPQALFYDRDQFGNGVTAGDEGEVVIVKVSNVLRQVYATTALADIVPDGNHAYYIRFYPRDTGQIGNQDPTTHIFAVSGTPLFEYRVENPTYPALDILRITKTTNQNGTRTTWTEMRKQSSPAGQWLIHDWADSSVTSSPVQHRWTYTDSDRSELLEVMDGSGTVAHQTLKLYSDINFGLETSRELASETVGTGGSAITTTYSYYTDPNFPGDWHRIRTVSSSDGSWTGFNYCNDFTMRGQIKETRRPHKNLPSSDPGFNPSSGEKTTFTYDFVDWAGTQKLPTRIETAIDNTVVSRSEILYSYETITDQSTSYPNAGEADMPLTVATRHDFFDNTQYLTSVTKIYREDADDRFRFFPGLPYFAQKPDGTATAVVYFHADFMNNGQPFFQSVTGGARVQLSVQGTVQSGATTVSYSGAQPLPSNFGVISGKSTQSRLLFGAAGLPLINDQRVFVGNWVTTRQNWSTYINSIWLDSISSRSDDSGGFTVMNSNSWTQGRLSASIGDTGIRQTYDYDAAGRVSTVVRDGATGAGATIAAQTTTTTYDAAGRVKTQSVTGAGSVETLSGSKSYDLVGRVTDESASGVGNTHYDYNTAARTTTVTLPNSATKTETRFLDGRVSSVTGSAVVAEYYDFSVALDGVRSASVNVRTSNDPRKQETWSDWLGRTTITRVPGFTGQIASQENFSYHLTTGRLESRVKTGSAAVRYEYDALSNVIRTGLDVDGGGLNVNSADRITDLDTSVELFEGAYWLTSKSWIYPKLNDPTQKLASTKRQRLTGLTPTLRAHTRVWDAENNESSATTTVDSTNKLVVGSSTAPGMAATATEQQLNGLAVSSTGFDGLTVTRAYDPLGRPTSTTFPRTGSVTTAYYPSSPNVWKTYDAANKLLSQFEDYDGLGRPKTTRDAYNHLSQVLYNAKGQVTYQWGGAATPVKFSYDDYGQRTRMDTYRTDPGDPTASGWGDGDGTQWQYHAATGLLERKTDAAAGTGRFVEYTYNVRGQTAERFWSRTYNGQRVKSTYSYDDATGELTGISYNDTTPAVAYTYTRLGQTRSQTDYTGARDFVYDATSPWRLSAESLPAFYGSRVVFQSYENVTSTNSGDGSYTGHTIGSVAGRANGYRLGTVATPAADLETIYAGSSASRIAGLVTKRGNGAVSRQFVYGYQASSPLLKSMAVVGNAFSVDRAFEANRDLMTRIESKWNSTVRTSYDYAYDDRRQRQSVVQAGDVFGDYGDAIHQKFIYNGRGELTGGGSYMGASPTSETLPMAGRRHEYTYDSIGNRKTSNTSGVSGLADDYTANSLNQYTSRENNTLSVGGVAADNAKVVVTASTSELAGRAGRHWGHNPAVANINGPFYGNILASAGIIGGAPGGKDLFRVESKLGALPAVYQTFTYDEDGNLTGDGVWTYQWDAENRLIAMSTTNSAETAGYPKRTLNYRYDAQNRRVWKQVIDKNNNSVVTASRFLYRGFNLIAEMSDNSGAALNRSYTWGLDLAGSLSATGGVGALVQIYDHNLSKTFFPSYDGNGNVAALINADTGATEAAYEYSPFGELLRCEGAYAKENPFRFSTKFTDEETGLVYYGARYYSPREGRFLGRDPIAEQGGLNLYGFCGNDGLNAVDYLGQNILSDIGKVFSKVGRAIGKVWDKVIKPYFGIALQIGFSVVGMPWVGAALGTAWDMAFNGLTLKQAAAGFVIGGLVGSALGPLTKTWGPGLTAAIGRGALIGGVTGGIMGGLFHGDVLSGALFGAFFGGLAGGTAQALQGSPMAQKLGNWLAPLRGAENGISGVFNRALSIFRSRPVPEGQVLVGEPYEALGLDASGRAIRPPVRYSGELPEIIPNADYGLTRNSRGQLVAISPRSGKGIVVPKHLEPEFLGFDSFKEGGYTLTDTMRRAELRDTFADVPQVGLKNAEIDYTVVNGEKYVLGGSNRIRAAVIYNKTSELMFRYVELPYKNYYTPEDVITAGNESRGR